MLAPVECIDNHAKFCDIVCAKLFHDNISNVKIDMKKYNMYYTNNQLSSPAKKIYEKMGSVMFNMLPICVVDVDDDVEEMKNRYTKMILMMKN